MAVPPRVQLGQSTYSRDWWADVNIGSFAVPNWVPINGWQELKPTFNPTTQDSTDFDSEGYKDSDVTAIEWGLEGKLGRKSTSADSTAYDPGQEVLRIAAEQMGSANRIDVRFYKMSSGGPRVEAYRGFTNVQWNPDGGGADGLDTVSVTLGGKGKRTSISHPDTGTPPIPVVQSIAPNTAGTTGGTLATITGTNFASVTAISVGGVALATSEWLVASGNKIILKVPPKTAGAQPVVLTNPGGTSVAQNITYS